MKRYLQMTLCSLMLIPMMAYAARDYEIVPFRRSITKTFNVDGGAELSITNKYGKINLHTWNNNQVKAVITITANGHNADEAKTMADKIDIQSNQSGNKVVFQTQYDQNTSSSFWKRFFSGNLSGNEKDYIRIDYEVYMPASLGSLTVENSYGDVMGNNISANFNLHQNYGNFHLGNISGNLKLQVNYCDGTINGIKSGSIQANYTDFRLDQVTNLSVNSNYSDCKITNAGQLNFHSNYGDVSAENIIGIISNSRYTDYTLGTLQEKGTIDITYGNARIKTLGKAFSGLKIKGSYADISVGIPQTLAVRIDLDLNRGNAKTGGLSLQQVEKSDDHGRTVLRASSAAAGSDAPLIQVDGSYTDVSLSER